MQSQTLAIFWIFCVSQLVSAQISYNTIPYSPPLSQYTTLYGSYNLPYPTNSPHRRIYIPGIGKLGPAESLRPYSYFRNDNSTTITPSDKNWSEEEPWKYTIFSNPTHGSNIVKYDNQKQQKPISNLYLSEMQNSWNQIPTYLRKKDAQNIASVQFPQTQNTPEVISKYNKNAQKILSTDYPYMTVSIHLLNDDSDLGESNPSNYYQIDSHSSILSSDPIVTPTFVKQSKLENYPLTTNSKGMPSSVLYYYKDPCYNCKPTGTTYSLHPPCRTKHTSDDGDSPSTESILGSIVSPYLTKNANPDYFPAKLATSVPTNSNKGIHNINSFGESIPSQTQKSKTETINYQSSLPTIKEPSQDSYYSYNYQDYKSIDEENSKITSDQNVDSVSNESILGTSRPTFYYTDYHLPLETSNLKLSPYLTPKMSLNNFWQIIGLDKSTSNPSDYYRPTQNSQNSITKNTNPSLVETSENLSKGKDTVSPNLVKKRSYRTLGFDNVYFNQFTNGQRGMYRPSSSKVYRPNYLGYDNGGNYGDNYNGLGGFRRNNYNQNIPYNKGWPY